VFVDHWIVIQIEPNGVVAVPAHIVLRRILPPLIERGVMVGAEYLVIEPQTEARAA
jgi:hypothetical protein